MNAAQKKISLMLFTIFSINVQAQDTLLNVNNYADCNKMLLIETSKNIGPTTAPVGYGDLLEFDKNSKESLHFMERENHSVWYKFTTKTNGNLLFEIEPLDSLNDYDFALYKYTGEGFCEAVKNKTILPVRTNFSRNKPEIDSKTGLSVFALDEFVTAGINPAYSKALAVKPKEEYVLLVNNVYENGAGHILHFDYSVNLSFSGVVNDDENKAALAANITLTNTKTGDIIAETTSDSITGAYKLAFDIPKSQMNDLLHLEIFKDGYFFSDTVITAYNLAKDMRDVKLKTQIKKLKKGDRFVVVNILFHGDSPKPLERSLPTIQALYKTMKRNKSLKISIEGHTNGCSHGSDYSMNLSNARAGTVYDFLVEQNISDARLAKIGYGCTRELYNTLGHLAYLNRRVEIEVLDY